MDKLEKAKHIAIIVFHSIWLAAAVVFYSTGIIMFNQIRADGNIFGAWMMWGFTCAILLVPMIWRITKQNIREGAQKGANTYSATVSSDRVTVSNHPFSGALFGLFAGIFLGLAAGPIATPYFAIKAIRSIVQSAGKLKKGI